jgi:hypothetical protein
LGGEEKMNDLANYITGGDYMKAKADAEKFKADLATANGEVDKIRADREAEKARLIKSVFKMKLANLDLPTISSFLGLSIEEIEQILS